MNGVSVTATAMPDAESARVHLAGELVFGTANTAKPQLVALLEAGCRRIVVDASELDYLDSSGLGVLLAAWQRTQRMGGRLELRGVHGQPARILALTGSDTLLLPPRARTPGTGPRSAMAHHRSRVNGSPLIR